MSLTPKEREQLVDDLHMTSRQLRDTLNVALKLTDHLTQLCILILRVLTAGR